MYFLHCYNSVNPDKELFLLVLKCTSTLYTGKIISGILDIRPVYRILAYYKMATLMQINPGTSGPWSESSTQESKSIKSPVIIQVCTPEVIQHYRFEWYMHLGYEEAFLSFILEHSSSNIKDKLEHSSSVDNI